MDETIKKQLQKTAVNIRMGVLTGTFHAKSGHPGGSLSIADLLTYLYFAKLNVDPKNPDMPDRDRLVLSKGHTAPALYSILAERGFFDKKELESLRHIGALLQGAKVSLDYERVFAVTLMVVLLSLLFEETLRHVWREPRR